jgi:molybdopterin converting factor small subunit
LVKVRIMSRKGDDREEMSPSQLIELVCKLGKTKHLCVDAETNEIIRDMTTIRDDQTITIIPAVAGGSQ